MTHIITQRRESFDDWNWESVFIGGDNEGHPSHIG